MIEDQVFSTHEVINGDLIYRIEVRSIGMGRYQQRHIWLPGNKPYGVSMEGADPWISSFGSIFHDVRVRGYEVSEALSDV